MMNYVDNYMKAINTEADLEAAIVSAEAGTTISTVKVDDIKIVDISGGPLLIEDVKASLKGITASDDAILDTMDGSEMAIIADGTPYLLSAQAKVDLTNKLGANCASFNKVSTAKQKEILDIYAPVYKEKPIRIVSSCEKARALLSENYKEVLTSDALETLKSYLNENFPDAEFNGGSISHDIISAEWQLNDEKLTAAYKAAISTIKTMDEGQLVLQLQNSQTGKSTLCLRTKILLAGMKLDIGPATRLVHKGNLSLEEWETAVNTSYAKLYDNIKNIARLEKQPVSKPVDCLINICSKIKLSKKALETILPIYKAMIADANNGLAVYYGLNMVLNEMSSGSKKLADSTIALYTEQIGKVLSPSFKWAQYDEPIVVVA